MRCVILVSLFVLFGVGLAAAQPLDPMWSPEECPDKDFKRRLLLREDAVRRATVGQPMYTLHPVPTSDREAVEIIVDYLGRQVERTSSSVNMSESKSNTKALLELIASARVRFDFSRVAQWRPKLRCNGPGAYSRWYFLVRAFDKDDGQEVLRAAVDEFGFPASWLIRTGTWSGDWMRSVEGLDATSERLSEITGRDLRDLQYVEAADSLGLYCSHLAPCVAARDNQENIYVAEFGDARRDPGRLRLVHIPPGGPSATEQDLVEQPSLGNVAHDRTWISVGGKYRLGALTLAGPLVH